MSYNYRKINGIDKDLYCNKIGNQYYYQGDCSDRSRNCLDEMYYSNKCPNVFSNSDAVFYLLSRFNNEFYSTFGGVSKSVFESYDNIKEGVKQSIAHQNSINLIKDIYLLTAVFLDAVTMAYSFGSLTIVVT